MGWLPNQPISTPAQRADCADGYGGGAARGVRRRGRLGRCARRCRGRRRCDRRALGGQFHQPSQPNAASNAAVCPSVARRSWAGSASPDGHVPGDRHLVIGLTLPPASACGACRFRRDRHRGPASRARAPHARRRRCRGPALRAWSCLIAGGAAKFTCGRSCGPVCHQRRCSYRLRRGR
jgi:hypothetical protein